MHSFLFFYACMATIETSFSNALQSIFPLPVPLILYPFSKPTTIPIFLSSKPTLFNLFATPHACKAIIHTHFHTHTCPKFFLNPLNPILCLQKVYGALVDVFEHVNEHESHTHWERAGANTRLFPLYACYVSTILHLWRYSSSAGFVAYSFGYG